MNNILEPLLQSPHLSTYVEQLTKILQEEEEKRTDFLNWVDEDQKAEVIKGEVVIQPASNLREIFITQELTTLLDTYVEEHKMGMVLQGRATLTLKRSNLMPDISFWKKEVSSSFRNDTFLFPAPAFVVEVVNAFSEKNDCGYKKDEYAANGVAEYWLIYAEQKIIEQYILNGEEYYLKEKLAHGTIQCYVLDGLEIALADIFGN